KCFLYSSRRRHTSFSRDWSSDVCSSDLHAGDGTRGLTLAASEPYDVLIVDRMLPGLDGLAVVEALRKSGKTTPSTPRRTRSTRRSEERRVGEGWGGWWACGD